MNLLQNIIEKKLIEANRLEENAAILRQECDRLSCITESDLKVAIFFEDENGKSISSESLRPYARPGDWRVRIKEMVAKYGNDKRYWGYVWVPVPDQRQGLPIPFEGFASCGATTVEWIRPSDAAQDLKTLHA